MSKAHALFNSDLQEYHNACVASSVRCIRQQKYTIDGTTPAPIEMVKVGESQIRMPPNPTPLWFLPASIQSAWLTTRTSARSTRHQRNIPLSPLALTPNDLGPPVKGPPLLVGPDTWPNFTIAIPNWSPRNAW